MTPANPLRFAVLEITNRCNLRCAHCASDSGFPRENELTLAEWRQALAEIHALGGEEITLIGGELFLRPDWAEIADAVNGLGMRLVLVSNGLLLHDEATLARVRALRPFLIGISVDGATPESYRRSRGVDGFDLAEALLHRLVADGPANVNAITTFTKGNLREFDRFADLYDGTGITWQVQIANRGGTRFRPGEFIGRDDYRWLVDRIRDVVVNRPSLHLMPMDDFGYFPLDPALRFLHPHWDGCIAGRRLIGVRSDGDVLGCLSLGDAFVEANLRRESLREIWESQTSFARLRNKEKTLTGACARCAHAMECRAGCTGIAHSATGDIGCNPYCIRALETEDILGGIDVADSPDAGSRIQEEEK